MWTLMKPRKPRPSTTITSSSRPRRREGARMDYLVISVVAFVTSGVTLFSGFGLGTVLMPTFALFFPFPIAIAATAVIHLANNAFKLVLVGRRADRTIVGRFGAPPARPPVPRAGAPA